MKPSFKLYGAFPRVLNTRTPISNPTTSVRSVNALRRFFHRSSTAAEPGGVADPPAALELPGWVKFSRKKFTFFSDSDSDFRIPEIDEWAKKQKLSDFDGVDGDVSGNGMVDDVGRDVGKISRVLKSVFDSPDSVAKAISDCDGVQVSEALVMKLLARFNNDWITAFGVFLWASMQSEFEISKSMYNMMVDLLGKCRKFELMRLLVEEMYQLDKGLVTSTTMHKVMKRLARAGKWDDVVEVYISIGRFGIEKNVDALNMLIDVLVKNGGIEYAERAF